MNNDGAYQDAETQPDAKNKHGKSKRGYSGKAKVRKRRLIVYEWCFWLLITVGSIAFFVNHVLSLLSSAVLLVGLIFGALALRLSLLNNGSKLISANLWCAGVLALSTIFCGGLFWYEVRSEQKPMPHFVMALRVGNSVRNTLLLTNDLLFESRFTDTAQLTKGSFLFRGQSPACVVIPVSPGESNKVFTFIFENDSAHEISDLEGAIGLPKKWGIKLNQKWKKTEASLIFPGRFNLSFTNLQFWAAACRRTLYPFDEAYFPAITNSCVVKYSENTIKEGFFLLNVRAAGFECWMSANVLFVPVPSNAFVPFLAKQVVGKNGKATLSLTKKQLEQYGNVTISEGQ